MENIYDVWSAGGILQLELRQGA
uniref:Uncharacterized protein n=1 Tax=Anguilla anguilla TaxID=7936 RepID=A0A0E9UDZ9_ANGAN